MGLITVTNTASTAVASGNSIPLTTISRRQGNGFVANNGGVTILIPGYYKVSGTVTFTGDATGLATVGVSVDGTAATGIKSSLTVGTASTVTYTLPVEGTIRIFKCGGSNVNLVSSGVAITTSNAILDITRV